MDTLLLIITIVLIIGMAVAWFLVRNRSAKRTRLVKSERLDENGNAKRIYLRRQGLSAKVWFEQSTTSQSTFEIHHSGDLQGYSVSTLTNEPLHLLEAREGLHDLGLDIDQCSWKQLLRIAE